MTAKFNISYTSDAGNVDHDSHTYSETNGVKFTDWLYAKYPAYSEPDENGDVEILPQTPARMAKSFRDWADSIYAEVKRDVNHHYKHTAGQAAYHNEPDIEPLP